MACQCGCATPAPREEVDASSACDCGCAPSTTHQGAEGELSRMVEELDRRVKKLESAA